MDIDPAMEAALWKAVRRSRSRAARANPPMAHSLPDDYALKLYHEQQGRCDITGQPFSLFRIPRALVKCPLAPSLDRINSHGGYTPDNVRLVFTAVNFGMGQWGEEIYLYCARAAVEHDRQRTRVLSAELDASEDALGAAKSTAATDWHARQQERIDAAEKIAAHLSGDDLKRQRYVIAGLIPIRLNIDTCPVPMPD
jgi:hypothetical protein